MTLSICVRSRTGKETNTIGTRKGTGKNQLDEIKEMINMRKE